MPSYIHSPKSTVLYKCILKSHRWGLLPPTISLLIKFTESGEYCFVIQRFSWSIFASFDAIIDMNSRILCNHSNIVVFSV